MSYVEGTGESQCSQHVTSSRFVIGENRAGETVTHAHCGRLWYVFSQAEGSLGFPYHAFTISRFFVFLQTTALRSDDSVASRDQPISPWIPALHSGVTGWIMASTLLHGVDCRLSDSAEHSLLLTPRYFQRRKSDACEKEVET